MRYTIGQLAEIIDGDRGKNYPKQDEFYPQGYCLFLNTGNVTKEGLIFEENQFIMKEKDEALRKGKLKRGDIVYTTRGTVGNAGYYNSSVPYENVRINSGMVILRSNGEIVDARFLYQILKSEYYRPYFKQYCTGSAQPQLPIKNFSQIYLNVPDIKTQHRIADILSVYDNLIENNQRQIKLLEEAAQRLYKEWFVNLRFPGHENTKIVDGVPEGWSKNPIQDFISYEIGGGWGEELQNEKSMFPAYVIRGTDIKGLVNGQLQSVPYRYHTAGSLETRKLLDGDIVFEVSGGSKTEGVARTVRIIDLMLKTWDNSVICASFCKRIKPIPSFSQYLYDSFRWMRLNGKTQEYDKKSASSIVNYRWKDFLAQEKILKPDEETISRYNNIAGTIYTKIIVCSCQIEQAKMKRDLLLPKLMNGEVEV